MRPAAARRDARAPPATGCHPLLAVPSLTGPAAVACGPPAPHRPHTPSPAMPAPAAGSDRIPWAGAVRARGRLDLLDLPGGALKRPSAFRTRQCTLAASGED